MCAKRALSDEGSSSGSTAAATCATTVPSTCSRWRRPGPARASGLVLPTLLTWTGSAVIHDIKGENWQLTAGWRARGSRCLLFDPTSSESAWLTRSWRSEGAHEWRCSEHRLHPGRPGRDAQRRHHWDKTAHALLTGAILHVLYAEEEKTLARVASFLADPSRSILRTLKIMLITNHLGTDQAPMAHPVVASVARELLNKSDNERSGAVSTAISFLGLYRDPIIAANTASSDWRIADLMTGEHPVSLPQRSSRPSPCSAWRSSSPASPPASSPGRRSSVPAPRLRPLRHWAGRPLWAAC